MGRKSDVNIGDTFNNLTLKERLPGSNGKGVFLCSCGIIKELRISKVKSGEIKSCGCKRSEYLSEAAKSSIKHGDLGTRLYNLWCFIKSCNNKVGYHKEWKEYLAFKEWALDNGYNDQLSVYRIDPSLEYSPKNCCLKPEKEALKHHREYWFNEKYGVNNPFKLDSVKEKVKATNLKRYGVKNVNYSKEIQDRRKNNSLNKYGYEYPQQTQEYRDKTRQREIDAGRTPTYNGKTSTQIAAEVNRAHSTIKAKIAKYGYELAMQNNGRETGIERIIKKILDDNSIQYQHNSYIDGRWADFLIKDNNLIIECDGVYWHSDAVQDDKRYHAKKKKFYEDQGYNAIFFREDEIAYKTEIVQSIILNKLGLSNKIYARKCKCGDVPAADLNKFVETNHLMGKGSGKGYGLYHNGELVAAIQIVNKRGNLEISRFCTKLNTNIVGGFSKLLKYIEGELNPLSINTFIDRRYGSGHYLKDMGFKLVNESLSFKWVKNDKTFHRMKYKSNSGYDLGCHKIWDCGQARWSKTLPAPSITQLGKLSYK